MLKELEPCAAFTAPEAVVDTSPLLYAHGPHVGPCIVVRSPADGAELELDLVTFVFILESKFPQNSHDLRLCHVKAWLALTPLRVKCLCIWSILSFKVSLGMLLS